MKQIAKKPYGSNKLHELNSYYWSSLSLYKHNKIEMKKIQNAIREVSKVDCIVIGI